VCIVTIVIAKNAGADLSERAEDALQTMSERRQPAASGDD
jgi:hypothetical protein